MEEILAKYFSSEASKDEISLVESWRSESSENANAYLEAKNIWLHTQVLEEPSSTILEDILGKKEAKQVSLFNTSWIKYGVAAAIVMALGLVFILSDKSSTGLEDRSLTDGSSIALHEESQLEVLKFDENVREVKITGRAYFDIERDETRPFIIHTENAVVKVLGTSFMVDTYNAKTEVCVESGLVELHKNGEELFVKLSEGEMGLITKSNKGIIKKNIDNPNYLSWKTKILTFKGETMADVAKILEDVYGIEVRFENQLFKQCRLTAQFNKKRPKDAIEIIARTFNIEYDFANGVAILKGRGC